jgi:exonuclease III
MGKRWIEKLNSFFEENNYKLISKSYSKDRFGTGIAFPTNHYDLLNKDIFDCGSYIKPIYKRLKHSNYQHKIKDMMEDLDNASDSKNIMISLHLCAKYYGKAVKNLIISTYHMPCRFDNKYYLYAHINALKVHSYELSVLWNTSSSIFCGDFNIIPNSMEYKLLTSVPMTESEIKDCESFNNMVNAYAYIDDDLTGGMNLRSVYKVLYESEPLYTNVMVQSDSKFLNCIDYILINEQIEIRSAKVGLTIPEPLEAPSPNGICPSDHCPLSASLFI